MPASIKHLTDKKLNLTSLLARWEDGLYYTAAMVKCDETNKRCLVCFEDGFEVWVNNRDVHLQLSLDQLNEDEDIVCCICDDGSSEVPNEIILCDVCQQGYHQKCHNPPVDSSKIDESEDNSDHKDWFCATCSYILNQSNRAKLGANAQNQQAETKKSSTPPPSPQTKATTTTTPPHKTQPKQQASPKSKPQQTVPKQQQQQPAPVATVATVSPQQSKQQPQVVQKQPVKIKQTTIVAPQPNQKTTVGPIKSTGSNHQIQKSAPYYPLSSQAATSSSSAALASMTASSALVVGNPAGRTKQDLLNQSNSRSLQRQRSSPVSVNVAAVACGPDATEISITPPVVKHAVRKSCMNSPIVGPHSTVVVKNSPPSPVRPLIKQSALPIATRSILPNMPRPAKIPHLMASPTTATATTTSTTEPIGPTTATIKPMQQFPIVTSTNPVKGNSPTTNNYKQGSTSILGRFSTMISSIDSERAMDVASSINTSSSIEPTATVVAATSTTSGKSCDSVAKEHSLSSAISSSTSDDRSGAVKTTNMAKNNNTLNSQSPGDVSNSSSSSGSSSGNLVANPTVIVNADSSKNSLGNQQTNSTT